MDCGTRERLIKVRCMRRALTPSGLVGVSRIIRKFLAGNFGKGENPLQVMAAASLPLVERNSGWLAETPKVNWPLSCLNDRGAARARSTRAQTNQSCLPFPSPLLFSVSPLQSQYSLVPSRHYKPNGRTDALCIFTTAASSSPSPNAISPASACNHRLLAQQDLT